MPAKPSPGVIPSDPKQWRPLSLQQTRFTPNIVNPLIEPLWSGIRVLVHYRETGEDTNDFAVLDSFGDDALDAAPFALDFLRRSITASEAVIDGIITTQATNDGEGLSVVLSGRQNPMSAMFVGAPRGELTFEPPMGTHRDGMPAFVALDLLSID